MQMDRAGGKSFSARSYLIHGSPRQRSEWLLCSNPPLLIPPSLHPSLLHTSPLPRSITSHHLSSTWPCCPVCFPVRGEIGGGGVGWGPHRVHRAATFDIFRVFPPKLCLLLCKWCDIDGCFWSLEIVHHLKKKPKDDAIFMSYWN